MLGEVLDRLEKLAEDELARLEAGALRVAAWCLRRPRRAAPTGDRGRRHSSAMMPEDGEHPPRPAHSGPHRRSLNDDDSR
jgi:hypothetical protein